MRDSRMLRESAMAWASVCPSVRPTLQPYRNDASYHHELFTVGCHGNLVYRDKSSCSWVRGLKSGTYPF